MKKGTLLLTVVASTGLSLANAQQTAAPTCRFDTARQIPVTGVTGSLQNPCFSPDGTTLAFTNFTTRYNTGKGIVKSVPLAGGSARTLSPTNAQSVNLPGQCWNATTNEVAYSSDVSNDRDEIYLVSAAGGTPPRRITDRRGYAAWEPSVSPVLADGSQWIVFESHAQTPANSPGELWKVRIGDGYLQQLTQGFNDAQPQWSPRGDKIVFQRKTIGKDNPDVYTIDTNGGGAFRVTHESEATDPSWSPSGEYIVYSGGGEEIEVANLFVVRATGGPTAQVTSSCGLDGAPGWSADGSKIAFESSPTDPDASGSTTLWVIDAPAGIR